MARPRSEPRTLLEHLIQQRDRTYEEMSVDFRNLDADALPISARHLARMARGERGTAAGATPATRRAFQAMVGLPLEEMLRPWSQPRDSRADRRLIGAAVTRQ